MNKKFMGTLKFPSPPSHFRTISPIFPTPCYYGESMVLNIITRCKSDFEIVFGVVGQKNFDLKSDSTPRPLDTSTLYPTELFRSW